MHLRSFIVLLLPVFSLFCDSSTRFIIYAHAFSLCPYLLLLSAQHTSISPPSSSSPLHPLLLPHLSMVTCCFADGSLCHSGCHWLLSAGRDMGSSYWVRASPCGRSSEAAQCLKHKTSDSELMTADSREQSIVGRTSPSEWSEIVKVEPKEEEKERGQIRSQESI